MTINPDASRAFLPRTFRRIGITSQSGYRECYIRVIKSLLLRNNIYSKLDWWLIIPVTFDLLFILYNTLFSFQSYPYCWKLAIVLFYLLILAPVILYSNAAVYISTLFFLGGILEMIIAPLSNESLNCASYIQLIIWTLLTLILVYRRLRTKNESRM